MSFEGREATDKVPDDVPMKDYTESVNHELLIQKGNIESTKMYVVVGKDEVGRNIVDTNFPMKRALQVINDYTVVENGQLCIKPGVTVPPQDAFRLNNLVNDPGGEGHDILLKMQNLLRNIFPITEVDGSFKYDISTQAAVMLASVSLGLPNVSFSGWKQSDRVNNPTSGRVRYRNVGFKKDGKTLTLREPIDPLPLVKNTPKYADKPKAEVLPIPKNIENVEVLEIRQIWNHAEALVDPCVLSSSQVNTINAKLDQNKRIKLSISAGIDGRPVRERSRRLIDDKHEAFKNNAKINGYETTYNKVVNKAMNKLARFPQTKARDANRDLLISRAMSSVEEIYCKIVEPRVNAVKGDAKVKKQTKDNLMSMLQIDNLSVGALVRNDGIKKSSSDLAADRYTQLDA